MSNHKQKLEMAILASYILESSDDDDDDNNQKTKRESDNLEKNVSKLNVILQNPNDDIFASEKQDDEAQLKQPPVDLKLVSEPLEQTKQSPMLTLNFKKLDRRASDLGSYYMRQNPTTKALTARHSIYGSEIFKRLRKAKASTGNEGEDVTENKTSGAVFSVWNTFLSCLSVFTIRLLIF